ncbi:MAG TPA: helix-turn-helix transcriptional regulator [Allosphingosinicella sp.]|jgi:transcriptional regulator with XRE-family HTH domain
MTDNHSSKPIDDHAYEQLVAEEELILHAQMLIQRVLNDRKITQKHLAAKLGVGESYVSQMLGGSARNLTLRTIARVMKALDVKATIVLDDHAGASLAETPAGDSKSKIGRAITRRPS